MSKKKILWFVPGATTPELKALAKANDLTIRNPLAYSEGAGLEDCDAVTGMVPKAYAEKYKVIDEPEGCSWEGASLRQDGPTVGEYVEAGYPATAYPPKGYASRSTAEEIAAAVSAQSDNGKMKVDEIRAALTEMGVQFDAKASKPDLAALLEEKRKEALDQAESAKVKGLLTEKGIEFAETATLDELKALLPAE
ncbi:HeH/LEM domain [Pseudomonas putida]|nr:HeH/LEM domain [Pseudomonas putida]CAB5578256.1 HeH/LEM domain [Pseudomonas putida]CAB5621610.1 HeH/LEM domain [Pseudomonas putida]CAB5623131.1 HeH/LEM domain [Pseudomonas putida]CAB5701990.1 HeH/LEM domain [Pseudomonas putida]